MAEEKIIITFTDDGPVIEVQGVQGQKCLELTEGIEHALGKAGDRKKKPEFYQSETTPERLRQKS